MTDQTQWKFDPAEMDQLLSGIGHNTLLGQRYRAHGPDWVELAMPWDERLVGDEASGALASGPIIALMDNTAGTSVWLRRGERLPQVTVDLRIDYLRPSRRGETLISRCECYGLSGSIAFVRGIAYETSPDDLVCQVAGTFMILEGSAA